MFPEQVDLLIQWRHTCMYGSCWSNQLLKVSFCVSLKRNVIEASSLSVQTFFMKFLQIIIEGVPWDSWSNILLKLVGLHLFRLSRCVTGNFNYFSKNCAMEKYMSTLMWLESYRKVHEKMEYQHFYNFPPIKSQKLENLIELMNGLQFSTKWVTCFLGVFANIFKLFTSILKISQELSKYKKVYKNK